MKTSTDARRSIDNDCARSFSGTGISVLEALRGERILITGASGFLGTWLLSALAHLNDEYQFDTRILAVARHPARAADRQQHLLGRKDIEWQAADIRQLALLPPDVSWIIHGAGNPDSREHATNPIETAATIATGTLRLLRLAEPMESLRKILHVSSGLVAAHAAAEPARGPSGTYLEAKRFAETLCHAFRSQSKLPVVVTRPFTFIGPFQGLDRPWAANNFLHAAVKGQPLKIRGDGSAVRSYLYGADAAMIALHQLVGGQSGDVFDLGGAEPMPVSELAGVIVAAAGRHLEIRTSGADKSGVSDHLVPDMAATKAKLGVAPQFSVQDAVQRSLHWFAA